MAAAIERTFQMDCSTVDAQTRFRAELAPALDRMGFRIGAEEEGHLAFAVRYMGGAMFLGIPTLVFWFSRNMLNHGLEVDFDPIGEKTRVTVYGRANTGIRDLVNVLGRRGHWPANREDPDWLPETGDDGLSEWDDIDPSEVEMDRMTRRALKKAGRL